VRPGSEAPGRAGGYSTHTVRAPILLVPVALAFLGACASLPTQTKFMEKEGVKVTSESLRMRLRAEAIPFTGLMEQTADAVAAASTDPAVRRRTLVWKINVVPALYRSLFNQRPLVALLDTWALLVQAEQYLLSSEGQAAFGPVEDRSRAGDHDRKRAIARAGQPAADRRIDRQDVLLGQSLGDSRGDPRPSG